MDHSVDQRRGRSRVRKDTRPVFEGEIGGEDEALLLIAAVDELEEEIGVARVVREITELVDDQQSNRGVVSESAIKAASRFLAAEIEEKLARRREHYGAPCQDGLVGDVLRDHRFAEAMRRDEDDVAIIPEEIEPEARL